MKDAKGWKIAWEDLAGPKHGPWGGGGPQAEVPFLTSLSLLNSPFALVCSRKPVFQSCLDELCF